MRGDALILDARHLLWRVADAFSDLHTEVNGEDLGTGGMYGFLAVAIKIHQRYGGQVFVAWEGSGNFRFDLYPEYKRKETPTPEGQELIDDMNNQEKRLKAMLRAMGVRQYSGDGFEADDVIGTLATLLSAKGKQVVIYSGDSDLRQLVNDNVTVVSPGYRGKEAVYDQEAVEAKHGVIPGLLADMKALAGDSSDNIPGIRGIGPKTAVIAINTLGDLDGVIRAANEGAEGWPIAERHRQPVIDGAKTLRMFKKLTTIVCDCAVTSIPAKRSQKTLTQHLMAYRFRSLMAPLELKCLMAMGK